MLCSYKMFQTLKVLSTTEYSTKKPDKWKKHSVLKIVLATFFGRNLSTSDLRFVQVTSVEKREPREHFSASACSFLGLGLQPRPQKCNLTFKNPFRRFSFFSFHNLGKTQIRHGKFSFSHVLKKIETKYYFLFRHNAL